LIIKVVTIFLHLTNIVEIDLKGHIIREDKATMNNLIDLIDPTTRSRFIDKNEEESHVLEYKIFWLLCVLVFKKKEINEYLFKTKKIKEFIERKAQKYFNISIALKTENNLIMSKKTAIYRNIAKFYEFVYYLLLVERQEIEYFSKDYFSKSKNYYFNRLMYELEENGEKILQSDEDQKLEKFIQFIKKLYSNPSYGLN
jgi:hypothetical protein